jgi:hypothetical protein
MLANMIAEDLPWEGAAKKIPSSLLFRLAPWGQIDIGIFNSWLRARSPRKGVRRLGPHCLGHIAEKIW